MNILITGGNFINKGAEAMILTVVSALKGKYGNSVNIYVMVEDEYSIEAKENGLIPLKINSTLRNKIKKLFVNGRINAIIDIGGYQFGDNWGIKSALMKQVVFDKWKSRGAKIYFLPQAWGPFNNEHIADIIKSILLNSAVAYVRDRYSMIEVEKVLTSVQCEKVKRGDDIAWNFQGNPLSDGKGILKNLGIGDELVVGISPNIRVYERKAGEGVNNQYIKYVCNIVNWLISEHDCSVVLLGHELNRIGLKKHDDRLLFEYIINGVKCNRKLYCLNDEYDAKTIKSIIGNFGMSISSRYHALIAALSQGVPSAAIGWSHKYEALMESVGLETCMLPDEEDDPAYKEVLNELITKKDYFQNRIREHLPNLLSSARASINSVIKEIEAINV